MSYKSYLITFLNLLFNFYAISMVYVKTDDKDKIAKNDSIKINQSDILPVIDIKINGLKNISKADILNIIPQYKTSKLVSIDKIKLMFSILYNLNYFSDIEVNYDIIDLNNEHYKSLEIDKKHKKGFVIKIDLKELLILKNIIISGNSKLSSKQIKKCLSIKENDYISEYLVRLIYNDIQYCYLSTNNLKVDINIESKNDLQNNISNLHINLNEHDNYQTTNVMIVGANVLNTEALSMFLKTYPWSFLKTSPFVQKDFNRDILVIEQYMKVNGLFLGKVKNIYINKDPDYMLSYKNKVKGINIIIELEEGDIYNLGEITVKGSEVFDDITLRNFFPIKKGDKYDHNKLAQGIDSLKGYYALYGYMNPTIIPVPSVDVKNKIVNLHIQVKDNSFSYIRNISYKSTSNKYYKQMPWTIDRELALKEGQRFNITDKIKSTMNLMSTGYYSSVDINLVSTKYPDLVDIVIVLTPKSMVSYPSLGASFNPATLEVTGALTMNLNNFLGYGWDTSIQIKGDFNRLEKSFSADTKWLTKYIPITFGFSITHYIGNEYLKEEFVLEKISNNSDAIPFIEKQIWNFSIILGYTFFKNTNLSNLYSIQITDYMGYIGFNINDINKISNSRYRHKYLSIDLNRYIYELKQSIILSHTTLDNPSEPMNGIYTQGIVAYSGGIYGGDANYIKLVHSFYIFYEVFKNATISFHYKIDLLFDQFYKVNRSISDVGSIGFYPYNLKGLNQSISSIISTGSLTFLSFEFLFPILNVELLSKILRGFAFLDLGGINNNRPSVAYKLRYLSIGIGTVIKVPMLSVPIRIAVTLPFDFASNDRIVNGPAFFIGLQPFIMKETG